MQGHKVESKVAVNVHAGAQAHARGEKALLMANEHKAKKSWWQKLSQSVNLAGAWLFLRILFVRLFLRLCILLSDPVRLRSKHKMCPVYTCKSLHCAISGASEEQWPMTGAGQSSIGHSTCERAQHSMAGLGCAQKGGLPGLRAR